MGRDKQLLKKALSYYRGGHLAKAGTLYRDLLARNPNHAEALHHLGLVEAADGRLSQAIGLMARAVAIDPSDPASSENLASTLVAAGQFDAALATCRTALRTSPANLKLMQLAAVSLLRSGRLAEAVDELTRLISVEPDHVAGLTLLGHVMARMNHFEAAIRCLDRALALDPRLAEVHGEKGTCCARLGLYAEALNAYDQCLAISPGVAGAWLGRGNVLLELKRPADALAAYAQALALNGDYADAWAGQGNALSELFRLDEAIAAYDRALAIDPRHANAWLGRGNALLTANRCDDAGAAFDRALSLNGDLAEAWLGRANLSLRLDRRQDAASAFEKALALRPTLAGAWLGYGKLAYVAKRYGDALDMCRKAYALDGDKTTLGLALRARMHICDWDQLDQTCKEVVAHARVGEPVDPLSFLALPSSAQEQLRCARVWVDRNYRSDVPPVWTGERYDHQRIRVGYLSAEFHEHPVSILSARMYELHDRSRFETFALSIGPDDDSDMRARLARSFEHFIDLRSKPDEDPARLIRSMEIDIVVDLNGFTGGGRMDILARRPAPVQVNYLGYPGTTGGRLHDYVIADRTIIPHERQRCFSEKIVYMPHSFMPSDNTRPISPRTFERVELGLPPEGFVYCCFNNAYKITPDIFAIWMRILRRVESSVLWLAEDTPLASDNLRKEAVARGIAADRLIFAKRVPRMDEHLARQRAADLFLDTLPYNAHTTANDALWAGLPVLTCRGGTFAGCVAASLLNAIAVPELVTSNLEEYEALAVALAGDPGKLTAIREKLLTNRLSAPLFDSERFTRDMETAYLAMWRRHQAGLAPDDIDVGSLVTA